MVGSVKTFGNKRRGDHSPDIPRDETLRSSNAPLSPAKPPPILKDHPCSSSYSSPTATTENIGRDLIPCLACISTCYNIYILDVIRNFRGRKWKNFFFFASGTRSKRRKKKLISHKLWNTYIYNIYPRRNALRLISRRTNSNKINGGSLTINPSPRPLSRPHISREPILITGTRTLTILKHTRNTGAERQTGELKRITPNLPLPSPISI